MFPSFIMLHPATIGRKLSGPTTNLLCELSTFYPVLQVHRIPIVDQQAKVIGIVTRTDIFTALGQEASPGIV